jgi:hypothetical protein
MIGIRFSLLLFLTLVWHPSLPAQTASDSAKASPIHLNQIQVIGTHNSYHLAPPLEILAAVAFRSQASAQALDYSHQPISYQLDELKIRQLEFDIYADPDGSLYSNPIGFRSDRIENGLRESHPNEGGVLDQPGFKILHSPDFDYRTTTATLSDALTQVRRWSKKNPTHVPILILIELKADVVGPAIVRPVPFESKVIDQVDASIRAIFPDCEMILPDDLRGDFTTLREAVVQSGWPQLDQCRGKVWFALDNTGVERDLYLSGHPNLENRVMFVSSSIDQPTAAFVKINDPVRHFDEIVRSVKAGLIVRTRSDSETNQARKNDGARRGKALASGAQYISTDYPEPDLRLSPYKVQLPNHAEYRLNPVSAKTPPRE